MLAEGLIHLRFMSPYTLFFINKKQGLYTERRFKPPNFTVCIMQYAEVLRQKVLKQREDFFFWEKETGILFSNKWETKWATQKNASFSAFPMMLQGRSCIPLILFLNFIFYFRKSCLEQCDFPLGLLSGYPFSSLQSRGVPAACLKAVLHLRLNLCLSWILIFMQDLKKFLMLTSR